jgi:hypothetical protein
VKLPKNAEPGGRYGSVVWTFRVGAVAPTTQAQNIAMESRVATLFYVRSAGAANEDGALAGFSLFSGATRVGRPTAASPIRFAISYENKGDVHLNPYGRVTVSGTFGDPRTLIVDPWAVLPGATRMREIDLMGPLSPGYYRAHLELNRGYKDIVDEADVAFWVMPSMLEFGFGIVLFVLLVLLLRRSLALSRHFVS